MSGQAMVLEKIRDEFNATLYEKLLWKVRDFMGQPALMSTSDTKFHYVICPAHEGEPIVWKVSLFETSLEDGPIVSDTGDENERIAWTVTMLTFNPERTSAFEAWFDLHQQVQRTAIAYQRLYDGPRQRRERERQCP